MLEERLIRLKVKLFNCKMYYVKCEKCVKFDQIVEVVEDDGDG